MSEVLITQPGANEPTVGEHVELLAADASILADYVRWIRKRDYEQKLYCPKCWDEKTPPTDIQVCANGELGIICPHRLTIFHGRVPLSNIAQSADDQKPTSLVLAHLADSTPATVLARWEAELLRSYKAVLTKHRYLEALWCGKCFSAGYHNGVKVVVTDAAIDLRCRCRHLLYRRSTD